MNKVPEFFGAFFLKVKFVFITYLLLVLSISVPWLLKTFPLADAETVVFTLSTPIDGFVSFFVEMALIDVFLPSVVILVVLYGVFRITPKKMFLKKLILSVLSFVLIGNGIYLVVEIPIKDYIGVLKRNSVKPFHSVFMRNYFYPLDIDSVEFDEKNKHNLIFIIAESMENGFGEEIPELLNLSKKNISFQPYDYIGGGWDAVGSKSTMSSTVSKITGFPLLTYNYSALFPKIHSIYDVLHHYGYENIFIQGTSGSFGFGGEFLESHGIDLFFDDKKIEKKGIAKYNNRITDKKLFDYAKSLLKEKQRRPFSLTIATIESHFPYGFYDESCIEKPVDNSDEAIFKATLNCSSRQINEFVEFVKKQPFFEKTEIVIVGDHLFKGNLIVNKFVGQRNWLSIFINPAIKTDLDTNRFFTSIDIAPTILESLGMKLPKHKMAFGTSLWSSERTLLETIGIDSLNHSFETILNSFEYNELIVKKLD